MRLPRGAAVPAALLLLLLALCSWQQHDGGGGGAAGPRLATGQGLRSRPNPQGSADDEIIANSLLLWDDILGALNENSGGKGTSGKPGTGNKGGKPAGNKGGKKGTQRGSGGNVEGYFRKLLQAIYTVGGAPMAYNSFNTSQTRGNQNYQPAVRNQKDCDSCVAQAVAGAIEASVASTLTKSAQSLPWGSISAPTLYYCDASGNSSSSRTCRTGWLIEQALETVVKNSPRLVQPATCNSKTGAGCTPKYEEEENWQDWCKSSLARELEAQPLKCTYSALSSFIDIQAAIRKRGSAVTRISIYDDFKNFTKKNVQGFKSTKEPYAVENLPNRTLEFEHALIITGYNNSEYSWTLLNSWGCKNCGSSDNPLEGATNDGLFRILMGQAEVGTTDQTYAVTCEPAPGSPADPHSTRPWRVRTDMPLMLQQPGDINNPNACFTYEAKPGDYATAIADAFEVNMVQFAKDNANVFPIVNSSIYFENTTTPEEMTQLANAARKVVNRTVPAGTFNPRQVFFRCWKTLPNNTEVGPLVECNGIDRAYKACKDYKPCSLVFPRQSLKVDIKGKELKVCGISVANPDDEQFRESVLPFLDNVDARQGRALKALVQAVVGTRGGGRPLKDIQVPSFVSEQCNSGKWLQNANRHPGSRDFKGRLVVSCNEKYNISSIDVGLVSFATSPAKKARNTDRLVNALLTFKDTLTSLTLYVSDGELPPQLGAFSKLQSLRVYTYCMTGGLPPNLLRDMPQLQELVITPAASSDRRGNSDCGVSGSIPASWHTANANISRLDLSSNMLAGGLPDFNVANWASLRQLNLSRNAFTGAVPGAYANLAGMQSTSVEKDLVKPDAATSIDISNNDLDGNFPDWKQLSKKLLALNVDNNPKLQGCIPLERGATVTFSNTGLSGLCSKSGTSEPNTELVQLKEWLPQVFNYSLVASKASEWNTVMDTLLNELGDDLRNIIPAGSSSREVYVPLQTAGTGASAAARNGISVTVTFADGVPRVTRVEAWNAGFNMLAFKELLVKLPQLKAFRCVDCKCKVNCTLPGVLAETAPSSFTDLALVGSGVSGTLPPAWSSWSTLRTLDLSQNKGIGGRLQPSWANLKLQQLRLNDCSFGGNLPVSWGNGAIAGSMAQLLLSGNNLQGSLPGSWSGFQKAFVDLSMNPMNYTDSCIPDGTFIWFGNGIQSRGVCSGIPSSQAGALVAIKGLLELSNSNKKVDVLPTWITSNPGDAGVGTPPNYCAKWEGVTCDKNLNVVGLNLANISAVQGPVNIEEIFPRLLALPSLHNLTMSGLKLQGNLSQDTLSQKLPLDLPLQHLDLSNNPSLVGRLPESWAAASDLQTLDLSGCGISGPLPTMWVALQQLNVLRLAAAGGQGGQLQSTLPSEWGLLVRLTELDISGHAGITGPLPAAWPDAAAMQAVAAAAASAAADRAAKAEAALAAATVQGVRAEVAAAGAGSGIWSAAQQYEQVTAAAREAAAAKRVLVTLQAAAAGGSRDGVSAASAGGGLGMRQLQVLRLAGCSLSGGLPAFLAGLQQLRELDLSHNMGLGGQLPPQWGALSSLQNVSLANCSLTGGVPTTFVTLAGLTALDLSDNKLGGTLPDLPFASLGKLDRLNLSSNAFEGTLPALWRGMRSARFIDVSRNALNGTGFPADWKSLVNGEDITFKLWQLRLSPGNVNMTVSNATVSANSDSECIVVPTVEAASAANSPNVGKCAVVYMQQPGGV